jgi:ribonuclease T2
LLCALFSWFSYAEEGNSASVPADKTDQPKVSVATPGPPRGARFDFYLLALTLHPAFCAEHDHKPECRTHSPVPLSIHGLWPETLAQGKYPRDCAGPALRLEPALARELAPLMPGMADRLHEHEWRKHGTCSGLGDDEYYRETLRLARRLDALLRDRLTTLGGGSSSAAQLREHVERRAPGLGASLTFHCRTLRDSAPARRGHAYLVEIRQCLDDDGPGRRPLTPLDCATVNRRDQGCGASFQIASERR